MSSTNIKSEQLEPDPKRIKLENQASKTVTGGTAVAAPSTVAVASTKPAVVTTAKPAAATTATTTKKVSHTTGALQQQIQAQLQQQLQAQLQAAAARGQQANITPEQIQAQAQAMVQAAAQAQAVVSAAKSRGDGLVPMNSQQIAALSQIQAQAIVNARPQTALLASGTPTVDKDGKPVQPTQAQIQHQITLQAQALVHAHTQAQIAAGIYKGEANASTAASTNGAANSTGSKVVAAPTTTAAPAVKTAAPVAKTVVTTTHAHSMPMSASSNITHSASRTTAPVSTTTHLNSSSTISSTTNPLLPTLTPTQLAQQNKLATRQTASKDLMLSNHATERANLRAQFQQENLAGVTTPEMQASQEAQFKVMDQRHNAELAALQKAFTKELAELHAEFRKQNAAAEYAGLKVTTLPNPTSATSTVGAMTNRVSNVGMGGVGVNIGSIPKVGGIGVAGTTASSAITTLSSAVGEDGTTVTSSTSPAFLEKLSNTLNRFWTDQLHQMRELGTTVAQTEQDFKNHNDLPLARIKRIMKSDEDVRMISAEAPVLFAKACEMFILELTLRSWSYSENNKRRTLQKEDIREAIQRTDIFDFLVDVIH